MSNLTGASATPQPFRHPNSIEKVARNQQESEKWDDLIAIVFNDQVFNDTAVWTTLNAWRVLRQVIVPCPVPCRLEITTYWSPIVQPSSSFAYSLGVGAAPIKGGSPAIILPNLIQSNKTSVVTGVGVTAFEDLACNGTIDVGAGQYAVQSQVYQAGSGSTQLNNSAITVRRGRKPVT